VNLLVSLKHVGTPSWIAHRPFTPGVLKKIEQAVKTSDAARRRAALRRRSRLASSLPVLQEDHQGKSRGALRAARVWDTAHNSGVLIYVQLVDRRIEIVADRGISSKVAQSEWAAICRSMEKSFKEGKFAEGALQAIERITALLAKHFPPLGENPNELPDKP